MFNSVRIHWFIVAAEAAIALTMAGCGVGTPGSSNSNSSTGLTPSVQHVSGMVHGGQFPITGAYVQLYAVGTSGYGTGATPLIPTSTATDGTTQSSVTTDSNGNFNISYQYTCPSATTQVYLTAVGGNPGLSTPPAVNNTAAAMVAALGPCGNLSTSTYVFVDEVTTVAAIWALQGFISTNSTNNLYNAGGSCTATALGTGTPGTATNPYSCSASTAATGFSIGAPSTNSQGLTNTFTVANVLANTTSGSSPGNNLAGTATNIEYGTVNLLANILASCVNQSSNTSSLCSKLFTYSKPDISDTTSTTAAPLDTLQAAYLIARNPAGTPTTLPDGTSVATQNTVSNLAGLASAFAPFGPTAPTSGSGLVDFTIAFDAGPSTTCSYNTSGAYASPGAIAFDSYGNAWIYNLDINGVPTGTSCNTAGAPYTPYLTEVGPDGSYLTQVKSYYVGGALQSIGNGQSSALSNNHPPHVIVDAGNNVYADDHVTGYIFAVQPSTGAGVASPGVSTNNAIPTGVAASAPSAGIQNIAVDNEGPQMLWFTTGAAGTSPFSTTSGELEGFKTSSFSSGTPVGVIASAFSGSNSYGLVIDNTPSSVVTGAPFIWAGNTSNCTSTTLGTTASTAYGDLFPVYTTGTNEGKEASFDAVNSAGVSTTSCPASSYPTSLAATSTYYFNNANYSVVPISQPAALAVDSGNNLWVWNQEDPASSTANFSTLPDSSIVRLSPSYNSTGTTVSFASTTASGVGATQSAPVGGTNTYAVSQFAIDGNSNVWITNGQSGSNTISQFGYFTQGAFYTHDSYQSPTGVYAISPATGWKGSTCISCTTSPGGSNARGSATRKHAAVDRSGNVWTSGVSTSGTTVTVIVGAATPVYTPLLPGHEGALP